MGQSKLFRSFPKRRKQIGKKAGYLVLTLWMALYPNDPTVLRAFQSFNKPIIYPISRCHQSGRPLPFP